MAWEPQNAATDVRAIVGNVVGFLNENQVDALTWANGGQGLEPLTIYPTAEVTIKDDYPHLGLIRRTVTIEETDAGLVVTYNLTWLLQVKAAHAEDNRTAALAQLWADTENYKYAVESMLLNIPRATALANVPEAGALQSTVVSGDPVEASSASESLLDVEMRHVLKFTQGLFT